MSLVCGNISFLINLKKLLLTQLPPVHKQFALGKQERKT